MFSSQFLKSQKISRREMVLWPWSGIDPNDARLIDDLNSQVVGDKYLTRQSRLLVEVGLCRQNGGLRLTDRARIAVEHLDPTRCASSVPATPVQDIYSGILKREHKPF